MGEAIYQLLVIAVAVTAIVRGFHSGLARQTSGVLGFAFGVVAARAAGPGFAEWLMIWVPSICEPVARTFFFSVLAYGIIWSATICLFSLLARILNVLMGMIPMGIVNSLAGAVFSSLKYLMFLSLLFDLAICRPSESPLMHCARHDDGNLVDCVIRIAPAILGCMSADDYVHHVQLWEAKKIS